MFLILLYKGGKNMKNKKFYTKKEFSEIINKDPRTIKTLEDKEIIDKGVKEGKYVLYKREDVLKALDYYENKPKTKMSDLIISKSFKVINKINEEHYTDNLIILEKIDQLKDVNKDIRKVFIDKNSVKKEEYDFLINHFNILNIEIINVDYDKN